MYFLSYLLHLSRRLRVLVRCMHFFRATYSRHKITNATGSGSKLRLGPREEIPSKLKCSPNTMGILQLLLAMGLVAMTTLPSGEAADFFTATDDLENVMEMETILIEHVEQYMAKEKERMAKIEAKLENLKRLNRESLEDVDDFLSRPMNVFFLIKRFMWEWVDIENWMRDDIPAREYIYNTTDLWTHLPTQTDMDGAAEGIWRLQDTYKLKPPAMLEGAKFEPSLKAHLCFELGRLAYHGDAKKRHAVSWLQESYQSLDDKTRKGDFFTLNETEIVDHLAFASFSIGRVKEAMSYTEKLIEQDPDSQRYQDNKVYFQFLLDKIERPRGEMGDLKGLEYDFEVDDEAADDEDEDDGDKGADMEREIELHDNNDDGLSEGMRQYEALCRGDRKVVKTLSKVSLRRCSYQHYGNPRLLLQPAKVEIVHDDPRVLIFKDIVSDVEIEAIKEFARPRLERATIWNSTSGDLEHTKHRISKSGWVKRGDGEAVERVYRRVEDYTGLSVETAEDLLAANYGLGGHYLSHYDWTKDAKMYKTGNRIATLLLYLTDVTGGGATVFPEIGLRILPEKGSAIFWHNLLRNGKPDYNTKHAACPVIGGSKWVANLWLHEYGQEFRRPCGLRQDDH